jgi:hypothetical protein
LDVTGGGTLRVLGSVIVNSEGGGVDENYDPVELGTRGYAAVGGHQPDPTTGVFASDLRIVGGVDRPDDFHNVDPAGSDDVLRCRQVPMPDPLLHLPVPTESNGVNKTFRGSPRSTENNPTLDDPSGENYIETDPDTGEQTMVLHPGIYESIDITGGDVRFEPGIYVLTCVKKNQATLKMTGGTVTAESVMFYNTGGNYDPLSGWPDYLDGDNPPPHDDGAYFGAVTVNASMALSPLEDETSPFNAMLFYQRRRNTAPLNIEGNADDGYLGGTLYGKWAPVKIAGQGTYDAHFIVGSIDVTGQGVVTVHYAGEELARAPRVFLVE